MVHRILEYPPIVVGVMGVFDAHDRDCARKISVVYDKNRCSGAMQYDINDHEIEMMRRKKIWLIN